MTIHFEIGEECIEKLMKKNAGKFLFRLTGKFLFRLTGKFFVQAYT